MVNMINKGNHLNDNIKVWQTHLFLLVVFWLSFLKSASLFHRLPWTDTPNLLHTSLAAYHICCHRSFMGHSKKMVSILSFCAYLFRKTCKISLFFPPALLFRIFASQELCQMSIQDQAYRFFSAFRTVPSPSRIIPCLLRQSGSLRLISRVSIRQ